MTIHRRPRWSGPHTTAAPLATVAALAFGLAGCPETPTSDAGDGGSDARADARGDVQQPDVQQPDVQTDTPMPPTDVPTDAADGAVPDPTPATVARVADCGTVCRRPTDAVLNAAGTTVFFTASDAAGHGGVFRVAATGGAITQISTGTVLQFPVSIAISDDDATLYVADLAADATTTGNPTATNPTGGVALGGVFSLSSAGGTPTRVNTMDAISQPAGIAIDGSSLIISGRAIGAMGLETPTLFHVPIAGGTPAVVFTGMGLVDPSDVAVAAAFSYYTVDTGSGSLTARVAHAGTDITFATGGGTVAAFPAGVAASRDGMHLLTATWLPGAAGHLTYTNADGTAPAVIASTDIVSPTGIGRAHSAAVYVVADELARPAGAAATAPPGPGSIFLVH